NSPSLFPNIRQAQSQDYRLTPDRILAAILRKAGEDEGELSKLIQGYPQALEKATPKQKACILIAALRASLSEKFIKELLLPKMGKEILIIRTSIDDEENSPLCWAVKNNHSSMVKILIEKIQPALQSKKKDKQHNKFNDEWARARQIAKDN